MAATTSNRFSVHHRADATVVPQHIVVVEVAMAVTVRAEFWCGRRRHGRVGKNPAPPGQIGQSNLVNLIGLRPLRSTRPGLSPAEVVPVLLICLTWSVCLGLSAYAYHRRRPAAVPAPVTSVAR